MSMFNSQVIDCGMTFFKCICTTNQIIKWDGKSQDGKEVYDGVYFYKMNYTEPIGGDKEIHGFLHLERK